MRRGPPRLKGPQGQLVDSTGIDIDTGRYVGIVNEDSDEAHTPTARKKSMRLDI